MVLKPAAWMLLGVLLVFAAVVVYAAGRVPDLQPWHETLFDGEIRATDEDLTFDALLEREGGLFSQLQEFVADQPLRGRSGTFDRYSIDSRANPARQDPNWNRTQVLPVENPAGVALLLHGLSDSPYSLHSVGELLQREGIHTVALRLPGHGTIPAELTEATWQDWSAAVTVAARHLHGLRNGDVDKPFFIVGYSTGAPLAVDYALRAMDEEELAAPTDLILFSPAIKVSPLAALSRIQLGLAEIPGLEKLAWLDVLPEFDPYKYNSFPVFAGHQVYLLSESVNARVAKLNPEQRKELPRILAFQSVVDATVLPQSIAELLIELDAPEDEVVYFDVNRVSIAEDFIAPHFETFIDGLQAKKTTDFRLTIVGNRSDDTQAVVVRTREAGDPDWRVDELDMAWPPGIYSLAHVALPFRADDPFYGNGSGQTADSLPLGSLELRGERGVFGIPASMMLRLRHNPFFAYVEKRLAELTAPRS